MSIQLKSFLPYKKFLSSINAFVFRDIKIKDNDLVLGVIYTILKPLFFVIVVSIAISYGFRGTTSDEVILTFTFPLIFWFFFNDAAVQASNCLGTNSDLRSLPNIHPLTIIIGVVISNMILTFLLICFIFVGMNFVGLDVSIKNLMLSFFLISSFTLTYCLFAAVVFYNNSFLLKVHDLFLRALFFASSVIVPINIFPESFQKYLYLNPLAQIMDISRFINLGIFNPYLSYSYIFSCTIIFLLLFFAIYRLRIN